MTEELKLPTFFTFALIAVALSAVGCLGYAELQLTSSDDASTHQTPAKKLRSPLHFERSFGARTATR